MFSFLKVFEGQPDHPMFDVKQARKLLIDLPKNDPLKALNEITAWLVSVKETLRFRPEVRAEIFMLLDITGLAIYEQLLQLYVGEPHLHDFKGHQLWQGLHEYKLAIIEAYALSIEEYQVAEKMPVDFKHVLPLVSVRLLRALAENMQLNMMRYVEVDQKSWNQLCSCYAFTLNNDFFDVSLIAYPNQSTQTTPHHEFLRAIMLYISSPSTLAPEQISACFRIAGHLVSNFDCKQIPDADSTHYVDILKPSAPRKIDPNVKLITSLRFFSAIKAVPKVAGIIDLHEQVLLQQAERSQNDFMPSGKFTVLKHLQLYWGKTQPTRNQNRQNVSASLEVIHDIRSISRVVTRIDQGSLVNVPAQNVNLNSGILFEIEELSLTTEIWMALDISETGVGCVIPKGFGGWVEIGDLCALKVEAGQIWWVGMIRRLKAGTDGLMQVGIEILAKKPLAVLLRACEQKSSESVYQWNHDVLSDSRQNISVILLPDTNNSYANATMLMASGSYTFNMEYELLMGEKNRNIRLTGLLEEGGDYERVSFTLL